jgi:predicted ATPase
MPEYVLTGAPGAGKTAVLRMLEVDGHVVVEEAATDVIALDHALGRTESWRDPAFIDRIVTLQCMRQNAVKADVVFHDRSPVCTLALSRFLGYPPSPLLRRAVDRVVADAVFFIRNQGFVRPTEARRISFADSLVFEQVHEETYRDLGFTLVDVPAGPLADRVALIRRSTVGT